MLWRSANHGLWAGPLLALLGFLSYFVVFSRWPQTRDVPWLNLLLLAGALWLTIVAARRAWPGGALRRVAASVGVLWSVGLGALLIFYCYGLSYGLPAPDGALALGAPVPAVSLVDTHGEPFDLEPVARKRLMLVFYRGHW